MASTMTDGQILLILTNEDCRNAAAAAFRHAKSSSKRLHVIQILASDLYHYGHQDLVATRPTKKQFLLYIRDEVLQRGKKEAQTLEETARENGITLEIDTIESEDIFSAALVKAQNGYETIFLPKQKRKFFPLFKKTLEDHLRKKTTSRIISC
jgi:hypothetical protein